MSFLSYSYALLLFVSALTFQLAPQRFRAHIAVGASGIFYASWNLSLCMLMFAAAVFAWQASRDIQGLPGRHRWAGGLVLSIMLLTGWSLPEQDAALHQTWQASLVATALLWLLNLLLPHSRLSRRLRFAAYLAGLLGLLGLFKYANFFVESIIGLVEVANRQSYAPLFQILLPVGISFFVFQKISFLVDVWRGDERDSPGLAEFCAYATFFPQLVAGPIERVTRLLPQLRAPLPFSLPLAVEAGILLLTGFFKKVFVADNCAIVANYAFDSPHATGPAWLVLGSIAFAFQIYGDFSGYTDIARGSALLLGIRLSNNFALPYLATSVIDFWHRWHMTLSSWLRDYLYKPLGGARAGRGRKYRNLLIVMVLGGLWHGANWNFVLWGLYWGLLLLLNHLWRDLVAPVQSWSVPVSWRKLLGWCATMVAMLGGWVLFRMTDLSLAVKFYPGVLASDPGEWRGAASWLLIHSLPLVLLHALAFRQRDEAAALAARPLAGGLLLTLALWLTLGSDATQTAFIYFQF